MTAWMIIRVCDRSCGGGYEMWTRTVEAKPLRGGKPCPSTMSKVQSCANLPCPTYSYTYSPWGTCSLACGGGTQRRLARCRSSDGKTVSDSTCTNFGAQRLEVARSCNTQVCPSYYWKVTSSYSQCSRQCVGIDNVKGTQVRNVQCWDGNTDTAIPTTSYCDSVGSKPVAVRECNSRKCVTYAWRIGAWSSCSKTCGGGVLARAVRCEASDGTVGHSQMACGTKKPSISTACNVAQCDPCAGEACSGHGTCVSSTGLCACNTGYQGVRCATPVTCDGVLDKDGECCQGVLLDGGTCCAGASAAVAADGTCCSTGLLDACGVCGGPAVVVDVLGTCCAGVLGEDGLCCLSSIFDTCGVCDGDDSTCNVVFPLLGVAVPGGVSKMDAFLADASAKRAYESELKRNITHVLDVPIVAIAVTVDKSSARRRLSIAAGQRHLAAALNADVTIDQAQAIAGRTSGGAVSAVQAAEQLAAASTASLGGAGFDPSSVGTESVCGNGVCEAGEQCQDTACASPGCRDDCPYVAQPCPTGPWANAGECSGHGRCIAASGACDCYESQGYTGAACSECKQGFVFDSVSHDCVFSLVSVTPSSRAQASGSGSPALSTKGQATTAAPAPGGAAAGAAAGAVLPAAAGSAVGVLLMLMLAVMRCRRARKSAKIVVSTADTGNAPLPPAKPAGDNVDGSAAAPRRTLFLSYGRGDASPFARWLKEKLEASGYDVWFDEDNINATSNWQREIGDALRACDGLVAVINTKYAHSRFCVNELCMANSHGKPLFPIMFRSFAFQDLPSELEYPLSSIQCIRFTEQATDEACFVQFVDGINKQIPPAPALVPSPAVSAPARPRPTPANSAQGAQERQGPPSFKLAPLPSIARQHGMDAPSRPRIEARATKLAREESSHEACL